MNAILADLAAAARLLTRVPIPDRLAGGPDQASARSVWAYPLIGAAVGAAGALVLWALANLGLPVPLAAGLAIAAQVLLTGALHEDGLADVADGFGGGGDKAHKLEIMRDSRLGTYGAIALIFGLGLRWGAVGALPLAEAVAALIAAGALGRMAIVVLLAALKPARDDGLGVTVADPPLSALAAAALIALLAAGLLLPVGAALLAILLAIGGAGLMIGLARRQVGGYTGDVLGAGALLAETAALLGLASVL